MYFYSLQIELEVKDILQENQLKSLASSGWECKGRRESAKKKGD